MADRGPATVRLRRTGGLFAGNVLEATVPVDELPEDLRQVAAALRAGAFDDAGREHARGADRFQYELVLDGVRPARMIVGDGALPQALRPLVRHLERCATRPVDPS